jgi:hypothetical protein
MPAAAAVRRQRWVPASSRSALLLLAAALAVGCSGGADTGTDSGQMTVSYGDATTPEAVRGRTLMRNEKLLEGLAADVNDSLKLPRDVELAGEQCGQANATWNSVKNRIKICYELVDLNLRLFDSNPADGEVLGELSQPEAVVAVTDATVGTVYHELGHAVISLYDLPVTGREEDVADQLAAFAILEPNAVLKDFPDPSRVAGHYAEMFKLWAAKRGTADQTDFAAEHSLNETRMYNLKCWIYGSDPAAHAGMITDGRLPEDRATGCQEEYQQLSRAWSTLLAPYLK